jgi:hypothetical protein
MRTIVVSSQPALALTLSAQLPVLDARPATTIDAVIDLTTDDAVVLIDAGSASDAERWLRTLRNAGIAGGVVVLDEVGSELLDAATVFLPRPFSLDQLEVALRAAATGPFEPSRVEGGQPMEAATVPSELPEEQPELGEDRFDDEDQTRASTGSEALVAAGLLALADLEHLLEEMPVIADPGACGRALLEELEPLQGCAAALAMRATGDQLEIVAASGDHGGLGSGHLDVNHPYVRAIVEVGGAMRIDSTDEARWLLAGVPYSHWPALLGVIIADGGGPEALVLIGCSRQKDDDELTRLVALVVEASPILRLAAGLQRLGPAAAPHYRRSWER